MPSRTIAIGDIHGCSVALDALLDAIRPRPEDTIVTLGDYINRGPDTRGVLDRLIDLSRRCRLVPILGNHDQMLLEARSGLHPTTWLGMGGIATLDSYGPGRDLDLIPDEHFEFLESCRDFYETDTHIFVHANYVPDLPMAEQPVGMLRWESLRDMTPGPHDLGQDGHRRPHVAEGRRDPRPGPPEVHRHLLPRRRLADGPGREDRGGLAGEPSRGAAASLSVRPRRSGGRGPRRFRGVRAVRATDFGGEARPIARCHGSCYLNPRLFLRHLAERAREPWNSSRRLAL